MKLRLIFGLAVVGTMKNAFFEIGLTDGDRRHLLPDQRRHFLGLLLPKGGYSIASPNGIPPEIK
jgi:hypothetical protein